MRSCITLFCLFLALVSTASAQDTVQVYQGWNILGSVIDGSAPEVLTTVPDSIITTSMFGYLPGTGYLSGDTLKKGLGYWVKVSADGIVIFKYSPSDDGCRGSAFSYQDRFYHTVKIGGQCWMADNLDVGAMITGNINQTDNAVIEKHCYNNDLLNCAHYGGLYQWDEAMQYVTTAGAQGICPAGWHLPTQAEFGTLSTSVGGDGNALKAIGQGSGGGSGTNTSGFALLLAGNGNVTNGLFFNLGDYAFFRTSTENASDAIIQYLTGGDAVIYGSSEFKYTGFSVRCVRDF